MDTPTTARTDFATRLYDKLAGTQAGKNLFLSPFSIRVALAMCAVGARGETRRVLADLIGAPESVEEQNRQYAKLLKSIHGDGDRPFQLVTANALWGQQGYHFNPDFKKAVADFYDGAFHEVDFRAQPDEAVKTINAWVSDKTREKIKELIKRDFINDDTRLILTNAIYFKGSGRRSSRRPTPGTKTGTAPTYPQGADDAPEGGLPATTRATASRPSICPTRAGNCPCWSCCPGRRTAWLRWKPMGRGTPTDR